MAGKKGNKAHANKTSFTSKSRSGIPAYEKWTEKAAEDFFLESLRIAKKKDTYCMEDIYNQLNAYKYIYDYLISKFPKFAPFKEMIKNQIIARLNKSGLKNEFNPTIVKFNLSANYNWKEKTENEQNHNFKELPKIQIIKTND